MTKTIYKIFAVILFSSISFCVNATAIHWVDWIDSSTSAGFQGNGVITTATSTVNVTYANPQGVGFYQPSGGTDYWQNARSGRDPATSPYTSATVDNIPTGTDIIALRFSGAQTLTFSESIANPVFSYVSLNGNGYAFDQDFEILSFGDASDGNDRGYWGAGISTKSIVDLGGGIFEYQLLGTGEPHGTIRFTGEFDAVSWRSLTNEFWNGFTVGIEGTADEINPVPVPAALWLLGSGLLGLIGMRKKPL